VGQIIAVENWAASQSKSSHPETAINNLVFMGMGEPLANYTNLIPALNILNSSWGMNIGARKITISTSGLAPMIEKLADEPQQFRLAISLHGATDPVRDQIMPINKKYNLARLTNACLYFQKKKGKMITLEYILIENINDSSDQIPHLARLAKRLHAKVNLIPYNSVDGLAWRRPSVQVQEAFASALLNHGVTATLRREKGHDIDAACGQLRLKTVREQDTSDCPS
jgi:23S rRNA (adenine2503-C2)-methyltransferase